MREMPILFSAPMVRALLAGTKTQTRRVVKKLPITLNRETNSLEVDIENIANGRFAKLVACPHGQPGDRLWVRETWHDASSSLHSCALYRADGIDLHWDKWTPSIHMPRWASRITLEITSVRVERLQEISIEDAKAEGAWGPDDSIVQKVADYFGTDIFSANPRKAFQMLWESINGPDSWAANPWVWVIEFRRLP